ncbi:MAG TPA: D-alanyl-D-alanine carboxypeptidase family protein [Pseudorhodoplanes sp.]|nr:D-alanyl-D-alanine carboxypeptidase family protein [Pseudorhodoplanes sp.]
MEALQARNSHRTGSVPIIGKLFCAALSTAVLCGGLSRDACAEATLLIEADTGKVLQAENAGQPWYPASVTKLMTAYVTLRAVKDGKISLDTLLTVSPNAVAQQPSKMGFKVGTQVTVDNALKMMMVKSANDIAVVLAEGVGGSIEGFADEMNKAASRLGMTQTSYVNPNGLPADGQITSARDLAILARAMIRELPEYDFYWHIPAIKFGKRITRNFNKLIDRYPGADGMKTGFICASGFNLVATATRNNKRLIAVVLGAYSSAQRTIKAATMLERGFNASSISWLTPSLGNVADIKPVDAPPPNLRDDICGKKRKRPPSEDEDDDAQPVTAQGDPSSPQSVMLSSLRGPSIKPSELLRDLAPSGEPVVVFVGPPKQPGAIQSAGKPGKDGKATATAAIAPANPGAVAPSAGRPAQGSAFAPAGPAPPPTTNVAPVTPAGATPAPTRFAAVPLPRPRPTHHTAAPKPATP